MFLLLRLVYCLLLLLCVACEAGRVEGPERETSVLKTQPVRALCDALGTRTQQIECYSKRIRQHIQYYWTYPRDASKRGYSATVKVYLDTRGNPLKLEFLSKSPHSGFNESIERAIYRAVPFPVPEDILLYTEEFSDITLSFAPSSGDTSLARQ